MITTVLKYVGSKQKALSEIIPNFPESISEYREPFIGGGSVVLGMLHYIKKPDKIILSDLDIDVANFWRQLITNTQPLINTIKQNISSSELDLDTLGKPDTEAAALYFIANRLRAFGNYGSISEDTEIREQLLSEILPILATRFWPVANILEKAEVYRADYSESLQNPTAEGCDSTFIFLDPPYKEVTSKQGFYKGHLEFDFSRLISELKQTKHKFLMTIDNSNLRTELDKHFNVREYQIYYGMSHSYVTEILVSNY